MQVALFFFLFAFKVYIQLNSSRTLVKQKIEDPQRKKLSFYFPSNGVEMLGKGHDLQ